MFCRYKKFHVKMPLPGRRVYSGRQAGAQKHEKFLVLKKDVQYEKMTNANVITNSLLIPLPPGVQIQKDISSLMR
jgi:hypothetical protein